MAAKNTSAADAAFSPSAPMHLDDFCNLIERETREIESLSAFARMQAIKGTIKQSEVQWRQALHDFMQDIPH